MDYKPVLLFMAFILSGVAHSQPVSIEGGLVEGVIENGMKVYKGIPFAAPPVGELRWRPPQPVIPWEGIVKADSFAAACPQLKIPMPGFVNTAMSEDCLYLNIWQPAEAKGNCPVMVWIHGGGFFIGAPSSPVYTGEQFARKGIVFVSIAYRLGALGFLAHKELSAESGDHISGNYGLLDQIAALNWVQRNITAFGGDPKNVTIFGESAGGQSVSMLAASPLARNLFHKAICMSGGSFGPASFVKDPDCMQLLEGAEISGQDFMQRMGASSITELRKTDPQKFLTDPSAMMGFWPVIDKHVIMDDQYLLYQQGLFNDIPVMVGNTSDEGTLFVLTFDPKKYKESIQSRFGPFAERVLKFYPDSSADLNRKYMGEIFSDSYIGWYTYAWANLQTRKGKSPVYAYCFNQIQPVSAMTVLFKSNGAYHGSDVAYVFNHLDQDPKIKYTGEDSLLAQRMISYWTNFAKTGNPNGKGLEHWPVYVMGKPTVLYLDREIHTGDFDNSNMLNLMDEYYEWKRSTLQKGF